MERLRWFPGKPALLAVLVAAACGDGDPGAPTVPRVAGSYVAVVFTATSEGQTLDLLALGASLEITLSTDGRTAGRLFVPEGEEDGSDFEADLAGTWTLEGDTVRFSHDADTFVRDMPFHVRDGRLEGDRTFGDSRVRVVLAKR